MSERVSVSINGPVADVRLNRPDKMNALDLPMFEALVSVGRELAVDKSLRAVVLSGQGRAFSAGLDFGSFMALAGDGEGSGNGGGSLFDRNGDSAANRAQGAAYVWREMPIPVIAAIHGVAYGGGMQIAAAADIRFVAPDARLSVREIQWGLIPDMSGTRTLRHVLRQDVAKELFYTGRIVSGTEAVTLGLATHTSDDPLAAAFSLAEEIAAKSPHAIREAKRLVEEAYLDDDEAHGLMNEEQRQRRLIGSPNQTEAVIANMEKRAPEFQDPS